MSADERFAERADQVIAEFYASEDKKRHDAVEELLQLVDDGVLERETVMVMLQELGAVALLLSMKVNPAVQAGGIRKLERSIDEAGDA
jgi:hypothetical protein